MKKISLFLFIFVFNLLADRGGWILTKSGEIKGKEVLSEPLQKAVLYWDGEKEILILGVNIKSETRGKLISFIPLPSKPKIKKAPGDIFKKMDNLVKKYAPVFEIYKPEILRKLPEVGIGKMKLPKRFKHSDIKSKGYVVIFSGKIGVHNLRVVYAENIDSFVSWVKRNYKNVPKNIERIVKLYIKNGKKYFVFDEVEIKDSANIKPLMYEFKSKSLYYPLRVNLFYRDTAEIVLYVLTNRKIPFGLFSSKSLMPILLYNFDIDFDKLPKWFAVRVKIEGLNDFMKYKVFNFRDVWQRLQFKKFLGEYRPVAFRVKEIEKEIKHDVMAMVRALAEACGKSGAYVHLGATSYDIVDTANALQLKEAISLIEEKLNRLERALMEKAEKYKETIMVGRTHGQHALPITLGFKFAVWMREIARHVERLRQCRERLLVGKISGAVGTQAGLGPHAMEIQRITMEKLGLKPAEITTQIVQRDRHAEFICLLANLASSLDKFATEIRELQRPEIGELYEPFERERQVGSSTMPHKRNPELCERICGLAKIMRSLTIPALENVVTWHERDLTQSSAERFIIPEACILIDYMLHLMTFIIENIEVDEERMRKNLEITQGRIMSEAVMIALTRKGMNRQEAHELLRKLAIKSQTENRHFREVLLENETVRKFLNKKEIEDALNPRSYLGTAIQQIERAIQRTLNERLMRKLDS